MTIVFEDQKFICYGPYFTHAIQPEGKHCADCHGNQAVQMIQAGQSVPMLTYEDGAVTSWKGVVPIVENRLDWVYLNKHGEGWTPIDRSTPELVQYVEHGTPLTDTQVKKMAMAFRK
jgi:hypothetical protein